MDTLEYLILAISILTVLWQLLVLREQVSSGQIAVYTTNPLVLTLTIFTICIVSVIAFSLPPFHLIWMAPVSLIAGALLSVYPPVDIFVRYFLRLLTLFADDKAKYRVIRYTRKKK